MTTSITKLPAASNAAEPAERNHGMDRVQEQLVYHVATLARSVLSEAGQLTQKLADTAMKRSFDHDGSKGTEPLDMSAVTATLAEALDCIDVASEQLSRLNVDIRMQREPDYGF
jgi:hypothetical protein